MRWPLVFLLAACAAGSALAAAPDPNHAVERTITSTDPSVAATALPSDSSLVPLRSLETLSGTHTQFELRVAGRRVSGAGASSTTRAGETISELVLPRRFAREGAAVQEPTQFSDAAHLVSENDGTAVVIREELVWYPGASGLVDALERTVMSIDAVRSWLVVSERATGRTLEVSPQFFSARPARVLTSNPVQHLNAPALLDQNDAAGAVPTAAYRIAVLHGLEPGDGLRGENITIVEESSPANAPILNTDDLTAIDRSDPRFESVNAYHVLDEAQRYLQALGYHGSRRIINRSLPVDPRALNGSDNSFYVIRGPALGFILFGIGGTDDAEDADILLHEYGHAIQDAISPGTFSGPVASQARAIAEGFSDYWAFSTGWADSLRSGRDPYCVAEWDARCSGSESCAYPAGADCLRRVDSPRTLSDFESVASAGVEHRNGEIWSSTLRRVFVELVSRHGPSEGKRRTDILAIEGHVGVPPSPGFATIARRMLHADSMLFGGGDRDVLCRSFMQGKILEADSCGSVLPEALYPGTGNVMIPDADPAGVDLRIVVTDPRIIDRVMVGVDVEHHQRADLKLFLIAPNGVPVKLHDAGVADYASSLRATYGLDTEPAESLDVLRGMSAAGVWTLRAVDTRLRDTGRVRSWNLAFSFAGASNGKREGLIAARIPVAANTLGANGAWSSDLILAAGSEPAAIDLWIPDAITNVPRSVELHVERDQTVRVGDVLGVLSPRMTAVPLELRVISGDVRASSALGTVAEDTTRSQSIPALLPENVARTGSEVTVLPLPRDAGETLTMGISETAGEAAVIELQFGGAGQIVDRRTLVMAAWQIRNGVLIPPGAEWASVGMISGEGSVAAWISRLNEQGDPAFLSAITARTGAFRLPVIASAGADGSQWRSELTLTNQSHSDTAVAISLHDSTGRLRSHDSVVLPALSTRTFSIDALLGDRSMFTGTALIETTDPIAIATLIRSSRDGHLRHQFVPPAAMVGGERVLMPSTASANERTNLVIAAGPQVATIRIALRSSAGVLIEERSLTLQPHSLAVLPQPHGIANGRIDLSSDQAVAAWISIVDNRSADADTWASLPPLR